MILRSLVELAGRENLLHNPDFVPMPVAWIIALGEGGRFLDLIPTAAEDPAGQRSKPKILPIPRRNGHRSDRTPDFLVEKSEYVLGIEPAGKRSAKELGLRLQTFRTSVQAAALETGTPGLAATAAFLASDSQRNKAIDRLRAEGYRSNDLFAFQFSGQLVHEVPEVQAYFSRLRRQSDSDRQQCLICGSAAPPVDKHPVVKIPGGVTSGAPLVSFNSNAFESYGLERNHNAPVCRECADAYTTALNRLLSDRYPDARRPGETMPRRFVRLSSGTTAVFWSEQETPLLDLFAAYFDAPRVESVAELFRSPFQGREAAPVSERFYCLVLSGARGRAVIRGMHTGTVAQVQENLRRYFAQIEIGSDHPLPFQWLLRALVLQGKLENLPPGLQTELFLAIVFGGKFSRALLCRAVDRCRAEQSVPRERAALLRAYLNRNAIMEVKVGLDRENTSAGYRLGRLLAVLERVQSAAQNNPNKTIVDRYYGAASTRPATVFPRLLALTQHHLAKLTGGLAAFYQAQLGEVIGEFAALPPTLGLEQQGLFALGYYHQRQDFFKKQDRQPGGPPDGAAEGAAA